MGSGAQTPDRATPAATGADAAKDKTARRVISNRLPLSGHAAAPHNNDLTSLNLIGIKNEAVDALIDKIVLASDRAGLVAAARALDRVLLWNHYVVPQWTYPNQRTARWDRFDRPPVLPIYGQSAFPTIWWSKRGDEGLIAVEGAGQP